MTVCCLAGAYVGYNQADAPGGYQEKYLIKREAREADADRVYDDYLKHQEKIKAAKLASMEKMIPSAVDAKPEGVLNAVSKAKEQHK